jgi:hypothetical protein
MKGKVRGKELVRNLDVEDGMGIKRVDDTGGLCR